MAAPIEEEFKAIFGHEVEVPFFVVVHELIERFNLWLQVSEVSELVSQCQERMR